MGDQVYRVRTVYSVEGAAQASSAVGGIASAMDTAKGAVGGLLDGLFSLKSALFSLGIGLIGKEIISLGSAAEEATIALAGMMQAGGAAGAKNDFDMSMKMSSEIMDKMRKDARDLPGEFEDLMNVFRGGLAGGMQAGQSINQIEGLSARMMAVSKTLQIESQTAGMQFAQMMEGRAATHNTLFMRLKEQIGMSAKEFNALAAPAKWAAIDKALKGYDPAIKKFSDTWSAVSSTTTDYAKMLLRIGGEPIFEAMKTGLSEVNGWFEANQQEILATARMVGGVLADAFLRVRSIVRDVFGILVGIGQQVAGVVGRVLTTGQGQKAANDQGGADTTGTAAWYMARSGSSRGGAAGGFGAGPSSGDMGGTTSLGEALGRADDAVRRFNDSRWCADGVVRLRAHCKAIGIYRTTCISAGAIATSDR